MLPNRADTELENRAVSSYIAKVSRVGVREKVRYSFMTRKVELEVDSVTFTKDIIRTYTRSMLLKYTIIVKRKGDDEKSEATHEPHLCALVYLTLQRHSQCGLLAWRVTAVVLVLYVTNSEQKQTGLVDLPRGFETLPLTHLDDFRVAKLFQASHRKPHSRR